MTEEKKKQLITALITEPNKTKACEVVGITTRTLYSIMQTDKDFMLDYKMAVNSIVDDTILELKTAMRNGAKAINDIINDKDATPEIRLKAIKLAIEYGARLSLKDAGMKTDIMTEAIAMMMQDS